MQILKRLALVLSLSLFFSNTAYCATTEDLYKAYNKQFVSSISSDVISVISSAEQVKIDAVKYHNILNTSSTVDVKKYSKELEEVSANLLNSKNKSYEEILDLEAQYREAQSRYQEALKAANCKRTVSAPSVNSVSLDKYQSALYDYKVYKESQEIGTLSTNIIHGVSGVSKNNVTTYVLYEPTEIYAPYNGVVSSVSNDTVDISLPDYVTIRIRGITQPIVDVGDVVEQHQLIGVTRDTKVIIGMRFNEDLVSFREGLNENN